ncbi:MAG: hypothetical protein KUG77_01725 [Nannocystaceae bacterium]|nr:hypothetical protein [Nannocystaceae bacterium]
MSTSAVRALSCALVSTLLAQPASATPPSELAADRYTQAQELLENDDYVGAAEIWESLLTQTPESEATNSGREAMVCNAIDARIEAYGRQVNAAGEKEPSHLVEGQIVLRRYLRAHAAAYGESKAVSAPVQERAATLAVAMADAQPERALAPTATVYERTDLAPASRTPPGAPPARDGSGLLVGGIGLGVLGLAAGLTMIPLGAALGRNAENIYTVATLNAGTATSEPQRALYLADAAEARRAGRTSNRVAIAGGVLSPLMLGGAAVMIVYGLQRQNAARPRVQHGPRLSPDYAGYGATLRF